ncbi:hypothetical protein GOBAR_DD25419 [Gossypium barbadense]|nr:hypothetical protein GOBAR_DD25419 [Gossypium barbadense]
MDMLREPDAKTMANSFFYKLIQLALLRLLPLHLSELCVAVVTIDSVSRKEKSEMVRRLVDKERWRGILVTSMYVQFVSNGFLLGSTWLMMNYYVIVRSFCYNVFTAAFLRICGVGLVVKFLEWMVMWNMSIVISTSEEVHGVDALGLSAYLCRGKERRGFWLTFVFFVSRIGLRFVCFNNGSYGKRWWMILGVSLICLGKVIKWVVCVMYFYHCKEGRLERVDVEVGEHLKRVGKSEYPRKKAKKRKLDLDWNKLLSKDVADEEPPPPLVVIKAEPHPPPRKSDTMGGGDDQGKEEFWESLPDYKLEEKILRQQRNLECLGSKLPDKGKKISDQLRLLEEEKRRRTVSRAKMNADECEKPGQSPSSDLVGSSNGFEHQSKSQQAFSQSAFGASFCKKLEENTDSRSLNTFEKSLSVLNHCDYQKMRCNGEFSQSERVKVRRSPRRMNSQHQMKPSFGDQKGRTATLSSLFNTDDNLTSIAKSSLGSEFKGQTVVIVDEEEPQLVKTTELEVELPNCLSLFGCFQPHLIILKFFSKKDARIYYPSRDDPESVEICFGDIDSLAPETFLTSQIMNFYIRYLRQQASPTNRAICDYHIFNTYFYPKLKEAVSYKGSDKDSLFIKFRRWWKGVNIFQKAYILIPINEDYHWSLVIICIPDKEEELRPIILHLDSLGLHSSRLVFKNIKSYMREEWTYLNQEVAPSDLPIADKIWENLPRRIDEKTIARFIEEAPERLKKKDLAMFGKQWFRPEEASSLRTRIRNLLIEQFQTTTEEQFQTTIEDTGGSQSSPSS